MKCFATIVFSLTLAGSAWAQPDDSQLPPPDDDPVMQPDPEPDPAPVPRPTPAPAPAPAPHHDGGDMDGDHGGQHMGGKHMGGKHMGGKRGMRGHHDGDRKTRPDGFSLGLGFGYFFPGTDITVPNIASARFRLPSGLTIEPQLNASKQSAKVEVGGVDATNDLTTIQANALVRLPVMSSRKLDLIVAGGVGFTSINDNPEGTDNATTNTNISLLYGLGVEYWYNAHWNISAQTLNPLFVYDKTKMDQVGGDTSQTDTLFGLIFEPNVIFMLHLFFE